MKRVLVALVAGTILSGLAAVYAGSTFTVSRAQASTPMASNVVWTKAPPAR